MPKSNYIVHYLLVDFGWWVTITVMVADLDWQLSSGLNFMSVVHFLLVDFRWWGTIHGRVADHPWQISRGSKFVS